MVIITKILAIDIDGCLTGNDYETKLYSKWLNKDIKVDHLTDYHTVNSLSEFGMTDELESELWKKEAMLFYENVEADEVAIKNIFEIAKEFDKVIILTKRYNKSFFLTKRWLSQHKNLGIKYDELVITDDKNKDPFIEDLNVTAIIEDNGYLTDRLKDTNITTYLVNRPYNKKNHSDFRIKSNYDESLND